MRIAVLTLSVLISVISYGQNAVIPGSGGIQPAQVFTSHDSQAPSWDHRAKGSKTVNGDGLDRRLLETSRFLSQASFGADLTTTGISAGDKGREGRTTFFKNLAGVTGV